MGAVLKTDPGTMFTAIIEICDTLSASYPENWWCVSCKWKSAKWALQVKKGVGESAEWNNMGYSVKFDSHVYTVPIAQLKERGVRCSAEKKRKAKKILESVAWMLEEKDIGVSRESVADEVVSRLDKEGLNWVHIWVSEWFSSSFFHSTRSDATSLVYSYVDILNSRYHISVFLTS